MCVAILVLHTIVNNTSLHNDNYKFYVEQKRIIWPWKELGWLLFHSKYDSINNILRRSNSKFHYRNKRHVMLNEWMNDLPIFFSHILKMYNQNNLYRSYMQSVFKCYVKNKNAVNVWCIANIEDSTCGS